MGRLPAKAKKIAAALGGVAVGGAVYVLGEGVGLTQQGLACLAILCLSLIHI